MQLLRLGVGASSGRGTVYTWTVVERALHPAFVASPRLTRRWWSRWRSGVRLLTQLTDVHAKELAIGMPVQVDFEAVTPEITLPYFKRA
jgi:uncharacterized OB-fold protein